MAPVKVDLDWTSHCHEALPNTTFHAAEKVGGSVLGFYRFIRHYKGNHSCFLFLRLLICLNSAGSLAYSQVEKKVSLPLSKKKRRRQMPTSGSVLLTQEINPKSQLRASG